MGWDPIARRDSASAAVCRWRRRIAAAVQADWYVGAWRSAHERLWPLSGDAQVTSTSWGARFTPTCACRGPLVCPVRL